MDNNQQQQPFKFQPITDTGGGINPAGKKKFPVFKLIVAGVSLLILLLLAGLAFYLQNLRPVDPQDTSIQTVEIVTGMTPDEIGHKLYQANLIRHETAFMVYTRISGVRNKLQAGTYTFTRQQSTQEIVSMLTKGPNIDEFEVTFLPGATLADSRRRLIEVGFSEAEVDKAFSAQYGHPLLEGKPADADLEGYIFGETHRFMRGTSVKEVLTRFFDDYYQVIKDNNLIAGFKQQGLTLFEGITLASIVQRESGGGDESQIAQVFLLRLQKGIQLGSDVTYQYIADKLGVARDVNLDNPYNTRRYPGLPPGPIASPGVTALKAVAAPAEGDYLYFLSGDDDKTYFARTEAEHEANIRNHCQKKCQII